MCIEVIDTDALDDTYEVEEFDVYESFRYFNELCFDSTLEAVRVSWSKKLTLSAGKCQFKETLLHEMIHAHMFLTKQYKNCKAHGKEFIWHMNRVNEITGLNVTVYHNFRDELEYYRRHVWQCTGPCRLLPPYFGFIRRARNMAPGPRDRWWSAHLHFCGGTFRKVEGPDVTSTASTTVSH
ncbi:hypothetical protein BgAZ_300440 [Babesia gibsoni]|uniref:SprT-like domain-containing protein n=1 Tax=Babesia gibsoni TaxID=33632 RepID=A0AAD8LPI6_BABGI|nr:hypothetical protein BgAZ_300440 [Babesia gibsoni]